VESLESRCLLSTSNIVAYPSSPAPDPSAIIDAGGKLWFTDESPSDSNVWMLNPNSPGIPAAITGALSHPVGITADSNGNVWVTEPGSGRIGMINTSDSTPTVQNFPQNSPLPSGAEPDGITAGLDQAGQPVIWFTDFTNNKIESYDPSTGSFSTPITPPGQGGFTVGSEIVAGTDADHTLWFPEQNSTTGQFAIGGYDPRTAQPFQVLLPKAANGLWETPYGITAGPGGNIWVGEAVGQTNQLGFFFSSIWKINPAGAPTEIPITTASGMPVTSPPLPYGLTVGPGGIIWFTDNEYGAIYSFNPTTGQFATESDTSSTGTALQGITTDSNGNIWFTDNNNSSIDVKYVATQLVVTSPPPATVTAGNGFSVSVTAEDKFGNVDPTYNGSVTLAVANNLGGNPITFTATASQGVAAIPVTLNSAGSYSLTATANGLTETTPPISVNVTGQVVNQATQLKVSSQSTTSVLAGSPFSLVIEALTSANALASSYSGTVTLTLASGPAGALVGTTIVPASGGFASFPSVTLSRPGTYIIQATASGLSSVITAAITVTSAPPAPYVLGATVVFTQKTNKKGKPVGKPLLIGYQFIFDTAMSSSSITNSNDYLVQIYVPAKGRGKKSKPAHYQAIGSFSLINTSSTTVRVLTGTKTSTTFKKGGRITLIGTGISSAAGASLGSNVVYNISPGGHSISPA